MLYYFLAVLIRRYLMKYSEFLRYLLAQGCEIENHRRGSHRKVTLNGKQSVFPYHGSKEIGTGLVNKIKKDLDLK
ncbi:MULTISPECIES: type II toxin-antitoxin system HicA family toxin [Mannheimia]|uniref:Type II toxin-antitoxin system HicA family toxin n=3 Tax=Mannheimia TaxID=75984 RepID=A0ABU7ZES4_9PAST|nr:type II toxin-antitoxin system HicA family toxin [Mannheimia haemolytica]MEE3732395.1 type II toxin-antitoxin system HicA family toxin [Mannheimia haemolytica]